MQNRTYVVKDILALTIYSVCGMREGGGHLNDKAITELFLARDEAALDEVARRYGRMLMSVALGITGNEQDAEECVNDTYLAVWNSIPPTKPENFQAYICRITHNLACRVLERRTAQKRQADVLPLTDELAEVIPAGDGASECDADGLSRAIDGFLRTLPRTARVMFVRRYFYADGIREIARLTGTGEANVSQILFRTRKKLKAFLEKEGFYL